MVWLAVLGVLGPHNPIGLPGIDVFPQHAPDFVAPLTCEREEFDDRAEWKSDRTGRGQDG